jgi:hypothetical protein
MNKDFFVLKYDKIKIKKNYPGLKIIFDEPSGLFGKNPYHLYFLKNKTKFFLAFTHYKPNMLDMWEGAEFEEIIFHSYMAGDFVWHSIVAELFPVINEWLPESHYQNFLVERNGFSAYLLKKDFYEEVEEEHFGEELSIKYGIDFMIFIDMVICNTIAKNFYPNSLDIISSEDREVWGSDIEEDVAKISIIGLIERPIDLIKSLDLIIGKDDDAFISYIVDSSRNYHNEMKYLFDINGLKSELFS